MNVRSLPRAAAATAAVFALLSVPLAAQAVPLNGCYLVNAGAPTDYPTGINFANWADAKAALDANGVSGAVTMYLVETGAGPNGGDFNVTTTFRPLGNFAGGWAGGACFVLDEWTGTSATNTVTIRSITGSPRVVVNGGGTIPIGVFFQGADFVNIEEIEFKNFTADAISLYTEVQMQTAPKTPFPRNNGIRRCFIHDNGGAGVLLYGNGAIPENTTIENCVFANNCLGAPINGVDNTTNANGRFGHVTGRRHNASVVRQNTFYQDKLMQNFTAAGTLSALTPCMVGNNSNTGTGYSVVSGNLFNISDTTPVGGTPTATVLAGFYRWQAPATVNNPVAADFNLFYDNSNGGLGGPRFATRQGLIYTTFAGYQTASAQETNSVNALNPLFVSPSTLDLTIATGSPAVDAGLAGSVINDWAGNPRTGVKPDCGAIEAALPGLAPSFKGDLGAGPCGPIEVLDGPAPLTVNFTDLSTNVGGPAISSWDWDFDNDGTTDVSGTPIPTHVYLTPGTYSVKLTVGDGVTTASLTLNNLVTVRPYPLVVTSTGGDLFLSSPPAIGAPNALFGYTFMSFNTLGTVGQGNFLGITFDVVTQLTFSWPLGAGDPIRFLVTGTPGIYPEVPYTLPAPTMYFLGFAPGLAVDFVQLYTTATNQYVLHTNVVRVTF